MRRFLRVLVTFSALALPVQATAADIHFCWIGDNGYSMSGRMSVPDHLMSKNLITEEDVTGFSITGFHDGRPLGHWNAADRAPGATWHLRFDPQRRTFLTGGTFSTLNSQGWNANGGVTDCGNPGFGFNSGNYAQDICLNGKYVASSSIAPETPLTTSDHPLGADCRSRMLLGKRSSTILGN